MANKITTKEVEKTIKTFCPGVRFSADEVVNNLDGVKHTQKNYTKINKILNYLYRKTTDSFYPRRGYTLFKDEFYRGTYQIMY